MGVLGLLSKFFFLSFYDMGVLEEEDALVVNDFEG